MNTNDKTLADVQPGGRVRLGDQAEKPPQELPELIVTRGDGIPLPDQAPGIEEFKRQCLRRIEAEYPHLAAQPSPGSQGGLNYERMFVDACAALAEVSRELGCDPEQGGAEPILAAIAELREALAARQPVGEPVALVVPGAPTRCRHCESTDLEWFAHVRAVNDVPHGRLTTHDVGCVFVLGCNECSETLHTVKADSIAALLAAPPAHAVDLGLQLDRYDAGLLGNGGGGDVNWWQDYIRAELDRAHEFYQDQADAHG